MTPVMLPTVLLLCLWAVVQADGYHEDEHYGSGKGAPDAKATTYGDSGGYGHSGGGYDHGRSGGGYDHGRSGGG